LGTKFDIYQPLEVDYNYKKKQFEFYAYGLCHLITGHDMDQMEDPVKEVSEILDSFDSDRFLAICTQHTN
jgi:hypothetical protein